MRRGALGEPGRGLAICLATHQTDVGPDDWRLNRVGVTPDVLVTSTPDDETARRDPQRETTLEILRTQTIAEVER